MGDDVKQLISEIGILLFLGAGAIFMATLLIKELKKRKKDYSSTVVSTLELPDELSVVVSTLEPEPEPEPEEELPDEPEPELELDDELPDEPEPEEEPDWDEESSLVVSTSE